MKKKQKNSKRRRATAPMGGTVRVVVANPSEETHMKKGKKRRASTTKSGHKKSGHKRKNPAHGKKHNGKRRRRNPEEMGTSLAGGLGLAATAGVTSEVVDWAVDQLPIGPVGGAVASAASHGVLAGVAGYMKAKPAMHGMTACGVKSVLQRGRFAMLQASTAPKADAGTKGVRLRNGKAVQGPKALGMGGVGVRMRNGQRVPTATPRGL